jgi:hypothetical protein
MSVLKEHSTNIENNNISLKMSNLNLEENGGMTDINKNQIDGKYAVKISKQQQQTGAADATAVSSNSSSNSNNNCFSLKRWNLVAMWSWDVECDVCAICRTPLMDSCLKCQTDNKHDDCVGKS